MTKHIIITLVYLLLLAPTVNAENKSLSVSDFATRMYQSWKMSEPLPHISQQIEGVTNNQAAIAQLLFVQQRIKPGLNEVISGYKAGLTSKIGQKKFNVKGAISGVLFASGKVNNGGKVSLADYRKLMLETEIGFVLSQDVDLPIKDIDQLKNNISAILPVIEMPNLAFTNLNTITGQDIIASNAIANRYLLGKAVEMPITFSLNKIETRLIHSVESNDKEAHPTTANQGTGKDALGDQWQALMWLVNERLESGYRLRKGQFLITGALGKMIPAKIGYYQADFGQLGKLTFTVTE